MPWCAAQLIKALSSCVYQPTVDKRVQPPADFIRGKNAGARWKALRFRRRDVWKNTIEIPRNVEVSGMLARWQGTTPFQHRDFSSLALDPNFQGRPAHHYRNRKQAVASWPRNGVIESLRLGSRRERQVSIQKVVTMPQGSRAQYMKSFLPHCRKKSYSAGVLGYRVYSYWRGLWDKEAFSNDPPWRRIW